MCICTSPVLQEISLVATLSKYQTSAIRCQNFLLHVQRQVKAPNTVKMNLDAPLDALINLLIKRLLPPHAVAAIPSFVCMEAAGQFPLLGLAWGKQQGSPGRVVCGNHSAQPAAEKPLHQRSSRRRWRERLCCAVLILYKQNQTNMSNKRCAQPSQAMGVVCAATHALWHPNGLDIQLNARGQSAAAASCAHPINPSIHRRRLCVCPCKPLCPHLCRSLLRKGISETQDG